MEWWRWLAAAAEACLLLVLLLLWFDARRDKPGLSMRQAARTPALALIAVPVGFALVLLLPIWIGLILLAVPALAVIAMALAS